MSAAIKNNQNIQLNLPINFFLHVIFIQIKEMLSKWNRLIEFKMDIPDIFFLKSLSCLKQFLLWIEWKSLLWSFFVILILLFKKKIAIRFEYKTEINMTTHLLIFFFFVFLIFTFIHILLNWTFYLFIRSFMSK